MCPSMQGAGAKMVTDGISSQTVCGIRSKQCHIALRVLGRSWTSKNPVSTYSHKNTCQLSSSVVTSGCCQRSSSVILSLPFLNLFLRFPLAAHPQGTRLLSEPLTHSAEFVPVRREKMAPIVPPRLRQRPDNCSMDGLAEDAIAEMATGPARSVLYLVGSHALS